MGVVYRAWDPSLAREVAVKMLHPYALGSRAVARLRAEAQALARVSHPNVVSVLDVGEARGRTFVAMELVRGTTMREWITRVRPDARAVLEMYDAVGRGLAAVHAAGLVHRDVKPDNILVDELGRPRLVDFGLARSASAATESSPGAAPSTLRPTIDGTPGYIAPEQRFGCEIDARADQFSFCMSLVEALTGSRPDVDPVANRIAPFRISGVRRSIAKALRRGLSPRPTDRFPNMIGLLAAMREHRRRNAVASALLGLAVAVVSPSLTSTTRASDVAALDRPAPDDSAGPTVWEVLRSSPGDVMQLDTHYQRAVTRRENEKALAFASAMVFIAPSSRHLGVRIRRAEVAWRRIDAPTPADAAYIEIARSHGVDPEASLVHIDAAILALSLPGRDGRLRAVAYNQRGVRLLRLGYAEEAHRAFTEVLRVIETEDGMEPHLSASPYSNLAQVSRNHGDDFEAEQYYFKAWNVRRLHLGSDNERTHESAERLVEWYLLGGNLDEAALVLATIDQGVAGETRAARFECLRGELLRLSGHAAGAKSQLERGRLGPHPVPVCAESLAELLRTAGQLERANALLLEAINDFDTYGGMTDALGSETRLRMVVRRGRVLVESDAIAEARDVLRDGLALARPALGSGNRWVREAHALLAAHAAR